METKSCKLKLHKEGSVLLPSHPVCPCPENSAFSVLLLNTSAVSAVSRLLPCSLTMLLLLLLLLLLAPRCYLLFDQLLLSNGRRGLKEAVHIYWVGDTPEEPCLLIHPEL